MGLLAKTLSPPSSYAAKKTDQWEDLADRIAGALLPAQLDDIEQWLSDFPLQYPAAWAEPLADLIEARRDELKAEDIGLIVRDRFDF